MDDKQDNIEAAMNKVAEDIKPTRPANTNTADGETTNKQVLIRATELDQSRWKAAAAKKDISMSEFIRNACNAAAAELLDCQHPEHMRRTYPWSDTCLKCGTRLK